MCSSSSAIPLQELARLSLNLLEQESPKDLQQPRDRTKIYLATYLGREVLVQTYEDGLGMKRCRIAPSSVTPKRRMINEPLIPAARRLGNRYTESPLVLREERRQRQWSSPHESPTGIPRQIPWYAERGPRSRWVDPLATPTRRGNRIPQTPKTVKLRLKFQKPATRRQLVTEFFALDTKGNPMRLL